MPRAFYISVTYQNDEEVLETGVWYVDFASLDPVNMLDMQTVCVDVYENLEGSNLTDLLPDGWYLFSVTCTTEEQGGHGPARHRYTRPAVLGASGEDPVFDSALMNIRYSGSLAGEPVSGGQRVSGIGFSQLDCNVIDDTWVEQVKVEWLIGYPAIMTVNGSPWSRAIRHNPALGPETFVAAPDGSISNRVGVRIDRVGNRTARRSLVTNGNGPT